MYSILIHLYGVAILIASLFSLKARQWRSGRKGLFDRLAADIGKRQQWIWFHASSLGEFEQGRPLIEKIRAAHPQYGILLTFYSPSGYLIRKDYAHADIVTYMPLDTAHNAKRFIGLVKPRIAIFIKYDIWYHHLLALEQAHIPAFLISAQFREKQIYFHSIGKFIGARLNRLQCIFTQTEASASLLRDKGYTNVVFAGDTRVDRVLSIATAPRDFSWLKSCLSDKPILVAGSSWPEDEARLIPALLESNMQCILAPHEIHPSRIAELERRWPGAKRLSVLKDKPEKTPAVIVDTIGDLSHLYALGQLAYVGGGYGKGIHNTLEPAAYGIPVLFGPHYQKFVEAVDFIELGAARSVSTTEELTQAMTHFLQPYVQERVRKEVQQYFQKQQGATERIYEHLQAEL